MDGEHIVVVSMVIAVNCTVEIGTDSKVVGTEIVGSKMERTEVGRVFLRPLLVESMRVSGWVRVLSCY